jgi:transcriptional regulator with XRE-family HTH domain
MTLGYSLRLRDLNDKAPSDMLGVKLGRLCIEHNIPVMEIANEMGVSRQAVYNWFQGTSIPGKAASEKIEKYIASLG